VHRLRISGVIPPSPYRFMDWYYRYSGILTALRHSQGLCTVEWDTRIIMKGEYEVLLRKWLWAILCSYASVYWGTKKPNVAIGYSVCQQGIECSTPVIHNRVPLAAINQNRASC
jgi:hypothetical protein